MTEEKDTNVYTVLAKSHYQQKPVVIYGSGLTLNDVDVHLKLLGKGYEKIVVGKQLEVKVKQHVVIGSPFATEDLPSKRYIITCKTSSTCTAGYIIDNNGKGLTHSQVEKQLAELCDTYLDVQVALLQFADFHPLLEVEVPDNKNQTARFFFLVSGSKDNSLLYDNWTIKPEYFEDTALSIATHYSNLQSTYSYLCRHYKTVNVFQIVKPTYKSTLVLE